jgi:hypothetical protein
LLSARFLDFSFADNQIESLFVDIVKQGNKIETFKAAANNLTDIEPKFIKRLKFASLIDFRNNTCIDAIFDNNSTDSPALHVFLAEVDLKCSDEDD